MVGPAGGPLGRVLSWTTVNPLTNSKKKADGGTVGLAEESEGPKDGTKFEYGAAVRLRLLGQRESRAMDKHRPLYLSQIQSFSKAPSTVYHDIHINPNHHRSNLSTEKCRERQEGRIYIGVALGHLALVRPSFSKYSRGMIYPLPYIGVNAFIKRLEYSISAMHFTSLTLSLPVSHLQVGCVPTFRAQNLNTDVTALLRLQTHPKKLLLNERYLLDVGQKETAATNGHVNVVFNVW